MNLKGYRSKRNLKKSPEPPARHRSSSGPLHFCVQKHAARTLHYDFRLEYQGVLLSWAVPKGPSLNPEDKRLAIKVEDHPLDYQYFEGVIPKGNYGAGTVEIWDYGSYTMFDADSSGEIEKSLTQGLKQGHFAIILHGEKLKGEFIFQKLKQAPEDNAWLLIKKTDSYADRQINSSKKNSKVKQDKIPNFISPMLATLVNEPFNGEDWIFEVKWDGYRALTFIKEGRVQLKSRTDHLLNDKFAAIVHSLEKINGDVILDGELVVLDANGRSDFQLMQNYQQDGKGALFYYLFDILYKNGKDLRQLPLIERKEILKKYLEELALPLIRFSGHIANDGVAFFNEASKMHLEGVIGKKIASTYQSRRSRDWVKVKTILRQEVVIGGFTAPRGSRKKFGALLVGVYDENQLLYAGHVGGGFDAVLLDEVYGRLEPLIQYKSPFMDPPKVNAPATWVKPLLMCEVSFSEWTKDQIMRQPIFKGLRMDKNPKDVKKEIPQPAPNQTQKENEESSKGLILSNLDKIYWPKQKYTKGDLIAYYEKVAPFILPYLKDRPIMLRRFPEGIEGNSFYQKDLNSLSPKWLKTFPLQHEGKVINYLIINDLRSLLYAVNLGSIDLHPFMSRYKKLENPDYCVIDLDPHEIAFKKVVQTAQLLHEILSEVKVPHYCKTSGGKGLHIYIPLHAKYDFEQSKQFAELICHLAHKQLPAITSLERVPNKRLKRIYLDYMQNRFAQTIVAPYAVRPNPNAQVSTPLTWEEVNQDLDPSQFNLKTIPDRLKDVGDLFKPVLKNGLNLKTMLARLKNV